MSFFVCYFVCWFIVGFVGSLSVLRKKQNVTLKDIVLLLAVSFLGPILTIVISLCLYGDTVVLHCKQGEPNCK